MIVVIGHPLGRSAELGGGVDGLAGRIAAAAARGGGDVQLVGTVGDDPAGDEVVLALAASGVGHAALLRDPSHATPIVVSDSADADDAADPVVESSATETIPPRVEPSDPALRPTLERADVELALSYLTEFAVLLVADPSARSLVAPAAAAAEYAGASLIVLVEQGADGPDGATVIEVPGADPDGAFATFVGTLVADLDRERVPAGGLASTLAGAAARLGWTRPDDAEPESPSSS